jgi:formylglycine-generating enzyme
VFFVYKKIVPIVTLVITVIGTIPMFSRDIRPKINQAGPPSKPPKGMVWIPGGEFWMGSQEKSMSDAHPLHLVYVDGFWMDKTEVTNKQFEHFVQATGYVTVAERKPHAKDFPGVFEEHLVPGSLVFTPPADSVPLNNFFAWWRYVPGAHWKQPEGRSSTIKGRENHPVVHIAYEDALAYGAWAGKRLPTEAEWECAARGGLDRKRYCWGDQLKPHGIWQANIWQGRFPYENTLEDGFYGTSPVGSFPVNGYGLYDMSGNVWEWCSDWYRPDYYRTLTATITRNPQGPSTSFDPDDKGVDKRVLRGGSFLCSDRYCRRYVPGGRGKGAPDTGACHIGFRCVLACAY